MESGFSSPRADAFPAGLRVLVVDDDPTWLKILEKMLKKCSYSVTTCGLAREALSLLRERKDGYDIVISDVNMPDMDGFKLLEHVGLEMDLPVIMMSVDGETSRVMKGVQHGACDYLLKPIRMKELRNIWQHVVRKRIHEVNAEILDWNGNMQLTRTGSDQSDDARMLFSEDLTSLKKRKEAQKMYDEKETADCCSTKKARVVWSVDLHQKFVKAVDQIGFDKVGPKKILDSMNVPWLTRENVASHLQKYRLYLSRLQKETELKPYVGVVKNPETPSRDSSGSLGIQNQIDRQQKNVVNGSYGYSTNNNIILHNIDTSSLECDPKGNVQICGAEPRRALHIEVPDNHGSSNSFVEFGHSFASPKSELDFVKSDSTFATQYSWCSVPVIQMSQENKRPLADDVFSQLQQPVQQQHLKSDYAEPSKVTTCRISKSECDIGAALKVESFNDEYEPKANIVSSVWSSDHLRPLETKVDAPNHQAMLLPVIHDSTGMKNQGLNWNYGIEYGSAQTSVHSGLTPDATSVENLPFCWVQGECYPMNLGAQNKEFSECCDIGTIAGIPNPLYGEFENDNLHDTADYSLLEHGLFIM